MRRMYAFLIGALPLTLLLASCGPATEEEAAPARSDSTPEGPATTEAATAVPANADIPSTGASSWPMFRLNLEHTAAAGERELGDDPRQLWRFATGGVVESSPALVDGVTYFGSHGGHIYALGEAGG